MRLLPDGDYAAKCRAFAWQIPDQLNIAHVVCDRWAETTPDAPAIVDWTGEASREVSFAQLRQMADALAHALKAKGVARGDRVGVLFSQTPWCAAAHIAIWKLGAISLPLFTLFGPEALAMRLEDAGCRMVVAAADAVALLEGQGVELLVPETAGLNLGGPAFETCETLAQDPAFLIYTSGTTGRPKGALHAHRALIGHLPCLELAYDGLPQPGDRLWSPADWAWIGGLFDVLMPGLYYGLPVVAARAAKFTPEFCRDVITGAGVRNAFLPPTVLRLLKAADMGVSGLRSIISGGEPVGDEMRDWARAALGVEINEIYGQTECNLVACGSAALYQVRPGAIGRPVPGHEVAVVGPGGERLEGVEGDIAVRRGSPVMMLEYWQNPQATAEKFRGDWLITGDRGVMEDGYLRFLGRDDDVITSAGYRIGPGEVEDCLLTHPAVASVGVVGTPDAERTELVTAFVILQDGWGGSTETAKALQSHVKTLLSAHEYPRLVHFVDALPMTLSGKIIRKELRARAAQEVRDVD